MHFAYALNSIIIVSIILVLFVKNTKNNAESYALSCKAVRF